MSVFLKRRSKKAGLPPGTPMYLGDVAHSTGVTVFRYDPQRWTEETWARHTEPPRTQADSILWVNLDGVHETELLERFRLAFGIHPLVMEDIVNTDQRPKMEDHGDYIYLVVKMLQLHDVEGLAEEQISIVVGHGFVLTFQEEPGDVLGSLRDRIRMGTGRVRTMDAAYLAYSILDLIVDHYFAVLEGLGEAIDIVQEEVLRSPDSQTLERIQRIRRRLLLSRKAIWPMRELAGRLERQENPLLSSVPTVYFRDIYDHTIHCIDTLEAFREISASSLEIYLTSISNRTNDVMKVLTIISTIFLPLSFIAGLYGMNFVLMPELEWPWGYPMVLGFMGITAGCMLFFFRRKGWL